MGAFFLSFLALDGEWFYLSDGAWCRGRYYAPSEREEYSGGGGGFFGILGGVKGMLL